MTENNGSKKYPEFDTIWAEVSDETKETIQEALDYSVALIQNKPATLGEKEVTEHIDADLLSRIMSAISSLCLTVSSLSIASVMAMEDLGVEPKDIPQPVLAFQVAQHISEQLVAVDAKQVLSAFATALGFEDAERERD